MSAALMVIPFVVGAVLATLTRMRIVLLALPALAIAIIYWLAVGWNGDDYDIGRGGLLLFTAFSWGRVRSPLGTRVRRRAALPIGDRAVTRLRWLEVPVLLVLLGATAYEAAIALEWIPVGTEPGENAQFEGLVMTLGLIALVAAVVGSLALAARSRRSVRAALFAPAAAALMVARFYTFDTYYLPDMTRYSEGDISSTWVYGLALASVVAALSSLARPRLGFALAALVIFLCLLTESAFGIGK